MKPELLQDMPESTKPAVLGTNGTSNTHTITENITSAEEQSNESNVDTTTPAVDEQTVKAVAVNAGELKPLKPANGEFLRFIRTVVTTLNIFFRTRCRRQFR